MNPIAERSAYADKSGLSVSYISPFRSENDGEAPRAIIVTDPDFIVTGLNPEAISGYKLEPSETIGQCIFDIIQLEWVGTTKEEAVRTLLQQGSWDGDVIYQSSEHKNIINTHCTLIHDIAGNPSSIIISSSNLSEKFRHQHELEVAEYKYQTVVESLTEGVVLIREDGTIGAGNRRAAEILGLSDEEMEGTIVASPKWNALKEDGSVFPLEDFPAIKTLNTGVEYNNVIMGISKDCQNISWISINSRPIYREGRPKPVAVVASFFEVTEAKKTSEKLAESETLFRLFMKNTPTLGWVYDEEGNFFYGNPLFMEIVGLTNDSIGKNIRELGNNPELLEMFSKRNKQVLESGEPILAEDAVPDKDGVLRYYLSYWFYLPLNNSRKLIAGHAVEITEKKKARKELEHLLEKYAYAINVSSDAIWDLDVSTNRIYRSEAFSALSGYPKGSTPDTVEWWFDKIHPADKKRISIKLKEYLHSKATRWECEYRFQAADGSYKYLLDKAFALYDENGRVTRVVGAMQDMTERKKLEQQLLHEQVQKQKLINQATFKAQEQERNRISGELHDNVNQLIVSAKLHIGVAKQNEQNREEMLNNATEYLMMALAEIRDLSKKLNSSTIMAVGLEKSIEDIAMNMELSGSIDVSCSIDAETVNRISIEQQMMVYRIVQEQSNNILKYAGGTAAHIFLREKEPGIAELVIADNGRGFEKTKQKVNGIGFINMFNRVDAYNGKMEIHSSPGNGCKLVILFPMAK